MKFGRLFARTALGAAFAFLAAGAQASPQQWNDGDRAALAHALKLTKGQDTFIVDFRDKQLAQFYRRQAERAGLTTERYPGFSKMLDDIAANHARGKIDTPVRQDINDDIIHLNLATQITGVYPTVLSSTSQYTANGLASLAQSGLPGFSVNYSSLCFYDQNNNPIGSCVTLSSFANDAYIPVSNFLSTSLTSFTAVFQATYYDSTNKTYYPTLVSRSLEDIQYPLSQTINDPTLKNVANPETIVCVTRGQGAGANPGTCSYGTYNQNDIVIAVSGSEQFKPSQSPQMENGHLAGTGVVSLVNSTAGGQCRFSPSISGSQFFSQPQVTYNSTSKTLSWNFPSLDFGTAGSLICGNQGQGLLFSLTLQNYDTSGDTITAAQTSLVGTTTPYYVGPTASQLAIPPLFIAAGCLAPDTKVTLADGRTVTIDKITGADEMVLSANGIKNPVRAVTRGSNTALYEIVTANGHTVRASAEHPFILEHKAIKPAKSLALGDVVMTAEGPSKIVRVEEGKQKGEVYNLVLAGDGAPHHTFYAGGVLVGDNVMQEQLIAREHARPEFVRASIPDQFKTDYDHALADGFIYQPHR